MKNLDANKCIKLINGLKQKKNYPYFSLQCLKNISNEKEKIHDKLLTFIPNNSRKIINSGTKSNYDSRFDKLIQNNKNNKNYNNINYKVIDHNKSNEECNVKNNFSINNKNVHISDINVKQKDKGDDLVIHIKYEPDNNKNGKKNEGQQILYNYDEMNYGNEDKTKLYIMNNYDEVGTKCNYKEYMSYNMNPHEYGKREDVNINGNNINNINNINSMNNINNINSINSINNNNINNSYNSYNNCKYINNNNNNDYNNFSRHGEKQKKYTMFLKKDDISKNIDQKEHINNLNSINNLDNMNETCDDTTSCTHSKNTRSDKKTDASISGKDDIVRDSYSSDKKKENMENFAKVKITKENIININEIKEEDVKKVKKVMGHKKETNEYNIKDEKNDNIYDIKVDIKKEEKDNIYDIKVDIKNEELPKSTIASEVPNHNSNVLKNDNIGKKNYFSSGSMKSGNVLKEEIKSDDSKINFQMKNGKSSKKCLYPHEIVEYLNKYIIGQSEAKKVVANALRQRWRRIQVSDDMKKDIIPKNILMIGPTGVGKTEIARRISMFVDAPFIKVEATKFTEVGFHGKDVDQIIKDLVEIAVKRQKTKFEIEIREQAEETVENIILYSLLGNIKEEEKNIWRKYLKDGSLDDKVISIDIPNYINNNIFSNDSVENAVKEALSNHQNIKSVKIIHQNINKQSDKKTMTIREARQKLLQLEIDSSINQDTILKTAINSVEEEGIVFIDEIDKICSKSNSSYNGPDASAEGVQRDLLPLIEGCVINTKYGNINTNYILFIASGAFQRVKPNDMLNELQGRLPVHVTLSSLTIKDFIDILTKTHNNLLQQNIALLKTEGIDLKFTDDAIETIANAAHDMNFYVENIGVRRLHTIIEKIMEDINYDVYNYVNQSIVIDKDKVNKSLEGFIKQYDLKKYII
ncbi:ATP-dependent protease HslVU, ATPase subunit [Plasmodium falciparum Santa Lucia]|uniref:ATP-dependent heat shock protein n=3 Tax=Plasmodium falciparum TaxID=5833 RepID=A0A0L1IB27_PLAFA|nr:ATP-dependent protease HslVU, ATPase subunit [Plasmodium falciparum Santa Lucia]EWC76892.1 ATP-dependent protease HslVU, ATPase subunit [Plasmodium falciparum UGT5.1]KNG76343.1 ATP-dependent heat shock protein [Plasmodium falciparum IGH-CR14]